MVSFHKNRILKYLLQKLCIHCFLSWVFTKRHLKIKILFVPILFLIFMFFLIMGVLIIYILKRFSHTEFSHLLFSLVQFFKFSYHCDKYILKDVRALIQILTCTFYIVFWQFVILYQKVNYTAELILWNTKFWSNHFSRRRKRVFYLM